MRVNELEAANTANEQRVIKAKQAADERVKNYIQWQDHVYKRSLEDLEQKKKDLETARDGYYNYKAEQEVKFWMALIDYALAIR